MKITQKSLSELPEGVHQIEPNFFIRVRGGYANFIFVYRKEGRRKEIALGSIRRTSLATAKERAVKLRLDLFNGKEPSLKEKKPDSGRTFNKIFILLFVRSDDVNRWMNVKHRQLW